MNLNNILLTDPSTGSPSTARTVFFYGSAICLIKLLLSGLVIGPIALGVFGGGDFAACIAALGGIYALDKTVSNKGGPSA